METKTRSRLAAGKNRYQDDKSADRPIPLRSPDSQACPQWRDETECPNETCNRKTAHRRQKERRLPLRNKDFLATNLLHNCVVPSISRRTAARRRAPYGENCWG